MVKNFYFNLFNLSALISRLLSNTYRTDFMESERRRKFTVKQLGSGGWEGRVAMLELYCMKFSKD